MRKLFNRLPLLIRIIIIALSIVTIVFWVLFILFHLWKWIGKFLHWISDPHTWWVYTGVVILLVVGGLVIAQLYSDWKPFTELYNTLVYWFDWIKNWLICKLFQ